jgi:argininosuccinate lyase
MKKLWQKDYKLNAFVEKYCSGENVELDNVLIIYDALGSIAHAKMLSTIGILTDSEFQQMQKCLAEIITMTKNGTFKVEYGDEDVHTKIEGYLIEKLGDIGGKINTGRSRNDQIVVDLRLYSKVKIFEISKLVVELAESFLAFSKKYEFVPMPGYTHMQKAMPSSVGLWADSFAESLIDDLHLLKSAYTVNDQSPLGSGAAYGVSLPLDRELTTELLGFSHTQSNSLYCQVSRPKVQLAIVQSLSQIMLTLSRFAEDVMISTMSEFNYFDLPAELCTGSSIMPQKKNVDIMEIVRARTHIVLQQQQVLATITAGLFSGYNSDFQETKKPFMSAIDIVISSLKMVNITVQSIKPNEQILATVCTPELFATHAAYQLVKKGMPFRQAYKEVAAHLDSLPNFDVATILKETNHIGGPGNLQLDKISHSLTKDNAWWEKEEQNHEKKVIELMK